MKNYFGILMLALLFSTGSVQAQPSLASVVDEAIDFLNTPGQAIPVVEYDFTIKEGREIIKNKEPGTFKVAKHNTKLSTKSFLSAGSGIYLISGVKTKNTNNLTYTIASNSTAISNVGPVDIFTIALKNAQNTTEKVGLRNNATVSIPGTHSQTIGNVYEKEYVITSTVDGKEVELVIRFSYLLQG